MSTYEKAWRKDLEKFPKLIPEFDLDPYKTALIIIDMQYYDAHPDYGLGKTLKSKYPETASYYLPKLSNIVLPNILKLLNFFRAKKLRVVHVTFGGHLPDGSDQLPLRKLRDSEIRKETGVGSIFYQGTFEHGILEELKPVPGEYVVNKTARSVFNSTGLDHALRCIGIEGLVFVGVIANGCVESSARGGSDRGYKSVMVDDACGAFDESAHNAAMKSFASFFGKVVDTDELIEQLSSKLKS